MKSRHLSLLSVLALAAGLLQGCPSNNSNPNNPAPLPTNTPTSTACTDGLGHTCTFTTTFTPTTTPSSTPTSTPTLTSSPTPNVTPLENLNTAYIEASAYLNGHLYGCDYTGTLYRFTDNGSSLSQDFSAAMPGGGYYTMAATVSGGHVTIFAADETDKLIQVYTDTGSAFAAVTSFGGGTYFGPRGVGLDGSATVYVSDVNNGAYQIDPYSYNFSTNTATAGTPLGTTGVGLNNPGGMAYDGAATLYVGAMSNGDTAQVYAYSVNPLAEGVSFGASGGLSGGSNVVAVDPVSGDIFVVDSYAIEKFSPGGSLLYSFSATDIPLSLSFDGSGHLYICSVNAIHKINTP